MADNLDTLLTTLTNLQREGGSAIQLYRARYASPEDVESIRFWVQNELDKIQSGFSSADEVVTILARAIQALVQGINAGDLQGEKGDKGDPGEPGKDGSDGRGDVYEQLATPAGSEGDLWFKTKV